MKQEKIDSLIDSLVNEANKSPTWIRYPEFPFLFGVETRTLAALLDHICDKSELYNISLSWEIIEEKSTRRANEICHCPLIILKMKDPLKYTIRTEVYRTGIRAVKIIEPKSVNTFVSRFVKSYKSANTLKQMTPLEAAKFINDEMNASLIAADEMSCDTCYCKNICEKKIERNNKGCSSWLSAEWVRKSRTCIVDGIDD